MNYKPAAIIIDINKAFFRNKFHQMNTPKYLLDIMDEFQKKRKLFIKINCSISNKFSTK